MSICENCYWWEKEKTTDETIVLRNRLWKLEEKPNKIKSYECNICGHIELSDSFYQGALSIKEHVIEKHQAVLDKYRNTRIGKCINSHFIYGDATCFTNETTPKATLSYMDGEGCSAFFYTDKDFGCIHFKETA